MQTMDGRVLSLAPSGGEDDGTEAAMFRGWYISSTKLTGGDFDPMTI